MTEVMDQYVLNRTMLRRLLNNDIIVDIYGEVARVNMRQMIRRSNLAWAFISAVSGQTSVASTLR